MSLADRMLATGAALHVERLHGDAVQILEGPDAGKTFTAVVEIEQDTIIDTELGQDPRPRRMLRFREGNAPTITGPTRVRVNGQTYSINRVNGAAYLTTDFEMTEIVSGKDA
jgi:hypothetical protein